MSGQTTGQMSPEKKSRIEHIIFNQLETNPQVVSHLTHDDKKAVQRLLAQKIAFETINDPLLLAQQNPLCGPYLQKAFFCLYPETCYQNFNIDTDTFFKRCQAALSFWKSDFLAVTHPNYDLYGPLWISVTYACILSIAGNIAGYWVNEGDQGYHFQGELVFRAFGLVLLFSLLIPLALGGVISMMGGNLPLLGSICMYGYSQLIFLVPALLCSFPSLEWQIGVLLIAGMLNTLFLLRNYYHATKATLNNNVYPLLVCAVTFQILYLVIIKQGFFLHNKPYLHSALSTHNLHNLHLRSYQ